MLANRMRERITLLDPVETEGRLGKSVESWEVFKAGVPAAVEPLRSREFFAAQQMNATVSVRIRIRYLPGVTARMRVKHESKDGTRYYRMVGDPINPESRNQELQLMCERLSNEVTDV